VDNAPADERTKEVANRFSAGYVVEPVIGLSRARNLGARVSTGEIIAYLDDDCTPEPEWLNALVREFEDERVMAVAGQTLVKEGVGWKAPPGLLIGLNCGGTEHFVVDRQTPLWFEITNFGGIGIGCNMAFRRRALEEETVFDPRLGRGAYLYGSEEHHAFFKLVNRGWSVVYTPQAVVHHACIEFFADPGTYHRKTLASVAGYATLLFLEEPFFRAGLLKYVTRSLNGGPPWREPKAKMPAHVSSRWHKLLACFHGPFLYALTRLRRQPDQVVPVRALRESAKSSSR